MVLAITLPVALTLAFLVAKVTGGDGERPLRLLRYALVLEIIAFVILCALGLAYEQRARSRDAKLHPPPSRLIDVGGYRMHLMCSGEGPTVVLEYGLEGSTFDWYRVQPELARFSRVCTYDRAGYGWSGTSPRPRVPTIMAEELHTLLQKAGERAPYVVVAHSYGSLVGQAFAFSFPQETAGLVLVDGVTMTEAPEFALNHKLWLRFMQWTMPFGLPRWRNWCGGPAEVRALAEAANCRSRVYAAYYREWEQMPEAAADMAHIKTLGALPLVVISRDLSLSHDQEENARHAHRQQDLIKLSSNAQFLVAERSGHDIPGQRPDVIVDAVKALLKLQEQAGNQGTP